VDRAGNTYVGATCSSWNTAACVIRYAPLLFIENQPLDTAVPAGTNAALSVKVNGTAPILYQWYFSGAPLAGANTRLLSTSGWLEEQGRTPSSSAINFKC
jgi:hypothetical protein